MLSFFFINRINIIIFMLSSTSTTLLWSVKNGTHCPKFSVSTKHLIINAILFFLLRNNPMLLILSRLNHIFDPTYTFQFVQSDPSYTSTRQFLDVLTTTLIIVFQ